MDLELLFLQKVFVYILKLCKLKCENLSNNDNTTALVHKIGEKGPFNNVTSHSHIGSFAFVSRS